MRNFQQGICGALVIFVVLTSGFAPAIQAQKRETSPTRTLTGHVRNRQDQPVTKAIVYLKNTKTLVIRTYISEPDGAYHFPALLPNLDYEVYAEFQGAHSDTKTVSAFDNRKVLDITLRIK
jgi:hypothetical protein